MSESTQVTRWGLLGAGWIARRAIGPALHTADGAALDVVAARDRDRAASLHPARYAADDYAAVIEDPAIDAVYVALSNDGHLPWSEAALRAGKTVLCEKPLTRDPAETRRLRAVADETGGLLVEATWNLWHPRTARAAALIASDAIGAVTSVSGTFTIEGVPEKNYRLDPDLGGGALLDVGCYPMTAAAWVTRGLDLQVIDAQVTRSEGGVDLTTDARLTMAGIDVHVRGSFIEAPLQTLVIEGSHGVLEFTGNDAFTSCLQPSALRVLDRDGERVEHFAAVDPYRLMIEHVGRAARGEPHWLPQPGWSIVVADAMAAVLDRD
jgi:xylose dehydrogenase (NAD/NADP)